jgi:hypothetical protein
MSKPRYVPRPRRARPLLVASGMAAALAMPGCVPHGNGFNPEIGTPPPDFAMPADGFDMGGNPFFVFDMGGVDAVIDMTSVDGACGDGGNCKDGGK